MPDRIGRRETQACFTPPEDEEPICRAPQSSEASLSEAGSSAALGPALEDVASSDYGTLAFSVNLPFFSISGSHTTDRFGQDYWGLGVSAGVAVAPPVGIGVTAGKLVRDDDSLALTKEDIREYLCGPSVSVRGGIGSEGGVANSSGGTAVEWGAETAIHLSVGFSHNWGAKCP